MATEAKVKVVEAEGFTVNVTMDDGTQYPFRTHMQAAKLFKNAPDLLAMVRDLTKALRMYAPPESPLLHEANALLSELRNTVA